jgi:hypothetical protein
VKGHAERDHPVRQAARARAAEEQEEGGLSIATRPATAGCLEVPLRRYDITGNTRGHTGSVRCQNDNRGMAETQSPVSPSAVGTWLCHYTTTDAAFEYILPTGQLRMSPDGLMRDPLEERHLAFSAAYFPDATPGAEGGYWMLMERWRRSAARCGSSA